RFQVLFHSPPGVLFTVPSRYWSAIGRQGVFRLRRWSSRIRTGFPGSRTTWDRRPGVAGISPTGVSPSAPAFSNRLRLSTTISDSLPGRWPRLDGPATPVAQRPPASARYRFALFRFRSPLLTESLLLSSPAGTEMFHFPACTAHCPLGSVSRDRPCRRPGFPIRTSSDHSLVGSSPRLIAAPLDLLRLLAPRHRPRALRSLPSTRKQ